jgi:hypothetical protein
MQSFYIAGYLTIAGIALAEPAHSQSPFGPWVHAVGLGDLYVAPNGNDNASGNTPANPVATLARALTRADDMLGNAPSLSGVTINMFPGVYTLTTSISVPAFGISIEPYRDPLAFASASVTLDATGLSGGSSGIIAFDRALGPLAFGTGNPSTFYSPSQLRGLAIIGGADTIISIDPTGQPTGLAAGDVIEVGIHQMAISAVGGSSAAPMIRISNQSSLPNVYRNVLHSNSLDGGAVGIGIIHSISAPASDVIMSNSIVTTFIGVDVNSQGVANDQVRPRIIGNFIRGQQTNGRGLYFSGGSAQIVSNTIAFASGAAVSGSIVYNPNVSIPAATLVVANNILFSPGVPEIDLTTLGTGFTGTLVFDFNAIESVDAGATGTGNVLIGSTPFVAANDLHLAPTSISAVGFGDQTSQAPGTGFSIGGNFFPTNVNLDFDGDARVHQPAGSAGAILHKGADQVVDGIRLRYDASVGLALTDQANLIGAVVPDSNGVTRVALALDLPPGSLLGVLVSGIGVAGPEFQHAVVPPWGAFALDPSTATFFVTGGASSSPFLHIANYGVVYPQFLEAETYMQALVLRTDGTGSFSNRLRIDFDGP